MADPSPKWTGVGRSVSALCAAIAAWTAWPAEASESGSTFSPCQVHPQRRSVRRGASLYARDSILVQVAWSPQPVERSWFPETKGVGHGDRILPWSVVFNEFTQAAPSSQLYCVQVMLVKFAPCALEGPLLSLRRHGAHLPTVTSPSCSQGGGAVFPGARGEDTLARRQQKMTLPVRRAEPS